MSKYVVTITRQFGSLGRPIAARMAEILGIEYYDRDIVDATARKLDRPVSEVIAADEIISRNNYFSMLFPLGQSDIVRQHEVFNAQQEIILDLADKGSCIIVGRCADRILENVKNHIRIYIYAPYEDRMSNCIESLKMNDVEARRMIREVDKARDAYHRHYAGYAPEDVNYKDLLINSSLLGVEGTAQYLAELIREKFGE